MQPYTSCIQINRIKILICGDKHVGKTSMIHAFRDDFFTEHVTETDEMVCRMHYIQDRRTLFQLVELHVGRLLPSDAPNAQAIMLLYDDDSATNLKRIKEYWYSKINLYFSHVPLFLVRTKCDLRTSSNPEIGERLRYTIHAVRYLECSAKQMTLAALKTKKETDPGVDLANSMTPLQGVAAVLSRLGSSGPLLKQIVVNVRECIANPAAFPDMKESIDSYLPFSLFGTTPTTAVNKLAIEDDLAVEKTQSDTSICSITPPAFCLTIKSASNESHISSEEMDEEKLLLEKEC
ncbi:hypothetical protein Q1695_014003 [Nippostrongylus brasiliensis]|nr:hypothetical protein Q1695_014003 [Nippostrongylus brasiliensis]